MDSLAHRVAGRHVEALYGDIPKSILTWLGGMAQLRSKIPDVAFTFLPHGVGIRFSKPPTPKGNYVEIVMNRGNYDLTFYNTSIVRDEEHQTFQTIRDELKTYRAVPGENLAEVVNRQTGIRVPGGVVPEAS